MVFISLHMSHRVELCGWHGRRRWLVKPAAVWRPVAASSVRSFGC